MFLELKLSYKFGFVFVNEFEKVENFNLYNLEQLRFFVSIELIRGLQFVKLTIFSYKFLGSKKS